MGLPREQRIIPKDLLKVVMENFERLNEISGLIPKKITKRFKSKYRRDTVQRPEIVNGLEEIVIYRPSNDVRENYFVEEEGASKSAEAIEPTPVVAI